MSLDRFFRVFSSFLNFHEEKSHVLPNVYQHILQAHEKALILKIRDLINNGTSYTDKCDCFYLRRTASSLANLLALRSANELGPGSFSFISSSKNKRSSSFISSSSDRSDSPS